MKARTVPLVALGVALVAADLFLAGITTASFFGDAPSRTQYLRAGVASVGALLPLAGLAVLGWLTGSRWGLLGLALPALAALAVGASTLTERGDPHDPDPGRALRLDDVLTDLDLLNAVALAATLLALVVALVSARRQAGAAARGSSSTPAS